MKFEDFKGNVQFFFLCNPPKSGAYEPTLQTLE